MKTSIKFLFYFLFVFALVLAGCSPGGDSAPPEGGEVSLQVTGSVANPQAWTESEVKTFDSIEVESTNKEGEVSSYTGVLITKLLEEAQPDSNASAVVFVADDGYTAEITLEELNACSNCIVSFRNQGGFSTVMPGFTGKLQVKGVIEFQVK
jgi:hypothetical protein